MPTIEIITGERRLTEDIVGFVKNFMFDMTPEGKQILTIQLLRLLDPEIKELRRCCAAQQT